ncbi:amidohydrolase family protein [Ketobacter sp.]|uniref:amidohydrolase family protein n=1 Tax=Ketobacter sp. TaxID=2083498 RepID=UPI0025BEEB16|nr:amidohydrolase family protein [Ketobacter sp.]
MSPPANRHPTLCWQWISALCAVMGLTACELMPQADPAVPHRSLASFALPSAEQACFDREREPYTAVVDAHFHPRPFGGPAMPATELFELLDEQGVRFVNYFGIGQVLSPDSGCTYYLDCLGVPANPSIKNDVVNAVEVTTFPHDQLHITLSMTFVDLAHPEQAARMVALYDREFPGLFRWAGELNVMKQALLGNQHEPATRESIDGWAPFMQILRERNIPVTLHADLGNDANPTEFLYLMEHVLERYPDNPIVWAHMGLSKELTTMDANTHVALMKSLLDRYPRLMLDISWDVLYNAYHQWGEVFVPFFNEYSTRILPGSDFVAAGTKTRDQYARELEVTSRALRVMDDEAFRNVALGENYFRLLQLDYHAPFICAPPAAAATP